MAFVLTVLYIAISLLSPGVLPDAIMMLHVNIILGVLTLIALVPQLGGSGLGKLPDTFLMMALVFAVILSVAATGWLGHIPTILLNYLPIFLVFYFVAISFRTVGQLRLFTFVLLCVALFILAQGVLADRTNNILSPYLMIENTGVESIRRYRGMGVLADPNDLGQFYAMLIPLLWLWWKPGKFLANFLFVLVPAALLVAGMFLTHSRGDAIALVAVALFGFKDKLGVVKSSILTAGVLAGVMALNISGGRGMNDDDGGRVAAWGTGLELLKSHPVFGVGIDNFPNYSDTGHTAHNSYVLSLSETGLIGYFFWMGMITTNWTAISRIARLGGAKQKRENLLPQQAFGRPLPGVPAPEFALAGAPVQRASLATPVYAPAYQPQSNSGWRPAAELPRHLGGSLQSSTAPSGDADLVHAARVLRVSFVGLLTAAFFLSRSFSMVFYIVLGASAAVRLMYDSRHPSPRVEYGPVFKKIGWAVLASVIFLYLFVRVRGVH